MLVYFMIFWFYFLVFYSLIDMKALINRLISLIFSDHCFEELFVELNFSNVECIKQSLSKALGTGIIIGSSLVKLPQIIKLYKAKSSEGISFLSVVLELIAISSAASYSYANSYPFSSWGESLFLLVETAIIGFLVLCYSKKIKEAGIFSGMYGVAMYILFSGILPLSVLWSMQIANIPVVVAAKFVQAYKNYSNGHTGQLSPVTVFLLFLGCLARILTSIQETGDPMIILTFSVASVANGVLAAQILYYWDATLKLVKDPPKETKETRKKRK